MSAKELRFGDDARHALARGASILVRAVKATLYKDRFAETSELVLALSAMGRNDIAKIVFNWIQDRTFEDGSYWCGFTCPDIIVWPEERNSWTNGVVLMAADALWHLTPASRLFACRSARPSFLTPAWMRSGGSEVKVSRIRSCPRP